MNKVKVLSNAVYMSALMSTSVVWGTTAFAAENTPEYFLDTIELVMYILSIRMLVMKKRAVGISN